jgi:hypothetical protein
MFNFTVWGQVLKLKFQFEGYRYELSLYFSVKFSGKCLRTILIFKFYGVD